MEASRHLWIPLHRFNTLVLIRDGLVHEAETNEFVGFEHGAVLLRMATLWSLHQPPVHAGEKCQRHVCWRSLNGDAEYFVDCARR